MALRVLLLRKEIDSKRKALAELLKADEGFEARKAELEKAIEEIESDEQRTAVDEMITAFESEKSEHEAAKTALEEEISGLERDLEELENKQAETVQEEVPVVEERKEIKPMETRKFYGMNIQERTAFFGREDVQKFLSEVRTVIGEKRAITGVGALIPVVVLDLLKENIMEYSKLYKHVNVVTVKGEGRMPVQGTIPEAVWTECCANLNELNLAFNTAEVDCWKVGGYFAVCNAAVEDSDIDLLANIMQVLGASIGYALDKAILYGTGTRMPLGVVTRLCQTSEPADYPATARTWVDLHTTNVKAINSSGMTAAQLFAAIVTDFGAAKGKYSRGRKVWVMNESTYTALMAATISIDSDGRLVTGVTDTMPVLGGVIEVLDFVPDNVIIGGYFDLYLLGERAGTKIEQSEHVRFIQDQTVLKGTARYDGLPVIAEGFVAMGINNTTPNASMSFAPDDANQEESE
ncbi:MAG: phage major capsid protein [Lachnospiraceae bacterium]|nr:phage major capsid protein [Lachnospiraceae bacterium]